jgi:HPt (histidine-containing phosphotransfer) domain-containing protein
LVFDPEYLRTMCDDDPEFEREVVGSFLDSAGDLMARMATALEAGDATGIRAAAHGLKGSSRSIGAPKLGDACAELETSVGAGDLGAAPAALRLVQDQYQLLVTELVAHLRRKDSAA